MPKARTVKQRSKQVLAWCKDIRPCGRPVEIKWVRWTGKETKNDFALVCRVGNKLVIKMNTPKCRTYSTAIDTVIHEYVHCLTWGMAKVEENDKVPEHGPGFWAEFGVLDELWSVHGGQVDSKEYDF